MSFENFSWRLMSSFFGSLGCVIDKLIIFESENRFLAFSSDESLIGFGWTEQDMDIIFYEASSGDTELAKCLAKIFSAEVFQLDIGVWIRFPLANFEEHMKEVKLC